MLAVTLGEVGGRQARFFTRASTGERASTQFGNDYTWLPMWFRLQREGDRFTASQSPDGISWFSIGSSTVALRPTALVGLAAASGEKTSGDSAFATFDQVSLSATPPDAPSAPIALAATALDRDEIQLSWKNAATNQAGFKIEVSTDDALFYEIADLAPDATRFVNTGLRKREGLHYRVRAYNTGGYSAYSNTASLASP